MDGLKIESIKIIEKDSFLPGYIHRNIDNYSSEFSCYFKSLIDKLVNYKWIIEEESTYISWEVSEEDYIDPKFKDFIEGADEELSPYRMYDNEIFKKYIAYVQDDWNSIICLKKGKLNLKEFVKNITSKSSKGKKKYLEEIAELIFLNIDGFFWLVFSNNESILNKLKSEIEKLELFDKVSSCSGNYLNNILNYFY